MLPSYLKVTCHNILCLGFQYHNLASRFVPEKPDQVLDTLDTVRFRQVLLPIKYPKVRTGRLRLFFNMCVISCWTKCVTKRLILRRGARGEEDPTWKCCPGLGHWERILFGFNAGVQQIPATVSHYIVKQTRKFSGSQCWSIFFLVLSYESYFSPISYITKHASQEGFLTGQSQETPCTDRNWFALLFSQNILKGWKQLVFISGY